MNVTKFPAKGAGLVLFDLDGTLIDAAADIAAAATPVLASHGFAPLSLSEAKSLLGDGLHAFIKRAFALRGARASVEDVQTYVETYETAPIAETRLYPGTEAVLRRVRADGWTMAVCTNKIESAAIRILDELGVLSHFQTVCGGDTVHACKPDPDHLYTAVERAEVLSGVAGEKYDCVVMVGDNRVDVLAANACGIPSIFAGWGYGGLRSAQGATAIADTVEDIPELLVTIRAVA